MRHVILIVACWLLVSCKEDPPPAPPATPSAKTTASAVASGKPVRDAAAIDAEIVEVEKKIKVMIQQSKRQFDQAAAKKLNAKIKAHKDQLEKLKSERDGLK